MTLVSEHIEHDTRERILVVAERLFRDIGYQKNTAAVIADGAASGEFEAPDVPLAAMCACTAMMRFFHPQMIAQCATKPGPSLDQMIDFVLAGLAPRGKATKTG